MQQFPRVHRLPPYVFAQVNELKMQMRHQGADIIDLGMGNPDLPTPPHIVEKLIEAAQKSGNHRYSASPAAGSSRPPANRVPTPSLRATPWPASPAASAWSWTTTRRSS